MYSRAKIHFKKADPILYSAAQLYDIANIRRSNDVFGDIVHAIVNQQLSGAGFTTRFSTAMTSGSINDTSTATWGVQIQQGAGEILVELGAVDDQRLDPAQRPELLREQLRLGRPRGLELLDGQRALHQPLRKALRAFTL